MKASNSNILNGIEEIKSPSVEKGFLSVDELIIQFSSQLPLHRRHQKSLFMNLIFSLNSKV